VQQHVIEPMLPELAAALAAGMKLGGAMGDHKSALQEHMQATGAGQPKYVLTDESGPDHNKRFRVEVRAGDSSGGWVALAAAEGSTKKEAQQSAAMLALEQLLSQNAGEGAGAAS
jgi:ribonuclease-3